MNCAGKKEHSKNMKKNCVKKERRSSVKKERRNCVKNLRSNLKVFNEDKWKVGIR